jgi:3-methyladenine DNA glycosylase/8-oxoguanine DNA glycosylase
LRRFLDLDADPLAIGKDLRDDPSLALMVESLPGLRVLASIDPLETICALILRSPEIPGPIGSLAELQGPGQCEHIVAFPPIEQIGGVDLSRTDIAPARSSLLAMMFDLIERDELDLSVGADLARAEAMLRSIPGMPRAIVREVRKRIFSDPDVSDVEVGTRNDGWSPWGSYATAYLRLDGRRTIARHEGDSR